MFVALYNSGVKSVFPKTAFLPVIFPSKKLNVPCCCSVPSPIICFSTPFVFAIICGNCSTGLSSIPKVNVESTSTYTPEPF